MRSSPATAALAHWALSGRAGSTIGQREPVEVFAVVPAVERLLA